MSVKFCTIHQLLLKGSVDVSGLAKIIISQDGVGSVIQVTTASHIYSCLFR